MLRKLDNQTAVLYHLSMKQQTFDCNRLKEARESLGFSQERMVALLYSEGLPMSRNTLISYEAGKTEPQISELLIMSKILKKPVEFFLP